MFVFEFVRVRACESAFVHDFSLFRSPAAAETL